MFEHIDDLDNQGRRCNVRVVGLPEGSEGTKPVECLETWIPEHLQMTVKDGRLKIDRAHRSLAPKNSFQNKQRVIDGCQGAHSLLDCIKDKSG